MFGLFALWLGLIVLGYIIWKSPIIDGLYIAPSGNAGCSFVGLIALAILFMVFAVVSPAMILIIVAVIVVSWFIKE